MRAVIQRVASASVSINGRIHASIPAGLLVLIGIEDADSADDVRWLAGKISGLRIFSDSNGKMNLSVIDIAGEILAVSQFTLHASTKKGFRPSFIRAAKPDHAIPLYDLFLQELEAASGLPVKSGVFAADMQVALVNDGPVTILIDSQNRE